MEVGCSMLNLLKGAELNLAQKKHVEAKKKKKLFWLEAKFLCQHLRRCFMGGGKLFLWGSPKISTILVVLSHHS